MTSNNCFITSSNLLTELDIKEHAIIERWRHIEKNRQGELKNSKHKFSSSHQLTLTQQIHDKIFYNENEQKLSKAYAHDSAKHEAIIKLLNIRQEQDRRNLARDINEFRITYQQSKNVREDDTSMLTVPYDSEGNRFQIGPGSCLYFEGEDQNKQDREKKQKEQMNRWIIEQSHQKHEAMKKQQKLNEIYDCNQLMIAKRIKNLEETQVMLRRQLQNDIKAFNKTLADQKRCQQNIKEAFELEDKQQEIQNMLTDNILTENRHLTISQFGPQHLLLTHWKGLTNKESQDYQTEKRFKTKQE